MSLVVSAAEAAMSESAGDAVIITIHKISGETFTTKARLEDLDRTARTFRVAGEGFKVSRVWGLEV